MASENGCGLCKIKVDNIGVKKGGEVLLSAVSFHLHCGELTALIGVNGAGKTTITNLINRFYDIADGKIRYDGININKIKKADLRRSLGIVLQETHLFSGSVHGIAASIVALGVYTSGSLYKIFKIHISQVGKEQKEAAQLLGLTPFQTFRHITLPQAYKTMMPLIGGELKLLLRSTSYAGYIAQKDLVKAVDAIRALTFDSFVPLLIVSLIYLLLSWLIGKGLNTLYVKFIKHD